MGWVLTSLYQAAVVRRLVPGRPAVPFIIGGSPRTGSTLLQSLLHSHRNAVCMHELLNDRSGSERFFRYNLGRRGRLIQQRVHDWPGFLQAVLCEPQPWWIQAVGFKALCTQPYDDERRHAAWTALGQIPDLHVTWLTRNRVRSVVSYTIAWQTGQWVGAKTREPVTLDVDFILQRLAFEDEVERQAYRLLDPTVLYTLDYNDLVSHTARELRNIQRFLELPLRPLSTPLRRQNPRSLPDLVANYDDLERALRGTRWHALLQAASRIDPVSVTTDPT